MPEEDEFEEMVNTIEDLSDIANLVRCPNCNEMTNANKKVCESCGFLRREERSSDEEEPEPEDAEFEERLNMTLKPMVPSKPRSSEPLPGVEDLEEALEIASGRPRARTSRSRIALSDLSSRRRGSSALTFSSVLLVVAGIATYLLSFFFLDDRMTAGAAMVLGAVLIVVFANVAVESAFASRRPVLVADSGRRRYQHICPECKTPLGADELECPICGSVFDS